MLTIMKKIILLCVLTAGLSACASMFEPEMFGMPESKFKSLSPRQQEMVIKSYNERQKIRAENEVAQSLVDAVAQVGNKALDQKQ